jgi:hypothetical protein
MKRLFFVFVGISSFALSACGKSEEALPADVRETIPSGLEQQDRPRDVRPKPATSGMSSDPGNPNGVPGPSSGSSTSPSRY